MVWSEAPTTGESRRQQLFPVAYRHRASSRLYHYGLRGPIRPHPSHVRSWKMPTSTSVGRAKLQQTLPLPPLAGQAVAKINHQNPP